LRRVLLLLSASCPELVAMVLALRDARLDVPWRLPDASLLLAFSMPAGARRHVLSRSQQLSPCRQSCRQQQLQSLQPDGAAGCMHSRQHCAASEWLRQQETLCLPRLPCNP
jgi:hypothetical protein